jgi:hypothetical protein
LEGFSSHYLQVENEPTNNERKTMQSYRTTILGVIAVGTAVLNAAKAIFDGDPSTVFDLELTIAAVSAGLGLIFARDNGVTSEQAGAK